MKEREVRRKIQDYLLSSKRKSWKCFYENCEKQAISSHILQKNGILNLIATNNHIYHIGIDPFKNERFHLEKIGVNDAFSFPGFCPTHDNDLFKSIEHENIDFSDYRTKLLFAYRILANESRKKEVIISWYQKILQDIRLNIILDPIYFQNLQRRSQGHKQALNDIQYYLKFFYEDLTNTESENFSFFSFEIPKIEACVSGVFTFETTEEQMLTPEYLVKKPLTDIYISIIPQNSKSIVIIGTLTEMKNKAWDFITSIKNEDDRQTIRNLSNVVLARVENWVCSEKLFKKLKPQERLIIQEIQTSIRTLKENRQTSINLFDL